jgi:protein gp37
MAENSKIEWTDHTFNPWTGCTKVSPGCDHCYAESWAKRSGTVRWGPGEQRRRTTNTNWRKPLAWNAAHAEFFAQHGRRQRVFCASLADVFDNEVDAMWRADLFMLISETPHLDWLLLTKRIGNAAKLLPVWYEDPAAWEFGDGFAHPNVWLGASIVNQEEADRDIPKLLNTPAAKHFLSMEPLLGPVNLEQLPAVNYSRMFQSGETLKSLSGGVWNGSGYRIWHHPFRLDWVIAGGENGPNARPLHSDWVRSLRDQCKAEFVPFHFKQWGEWLPWTQFNEARVDDPPEQTRFQTAEWNGETWGDVGRPMWCDSKDGLIDDLQCVGRVGKKAAGRVLDGLTHDAFPGGVHA